MLCAVEVPQRRKELQSLAARSLLVFAILDQQRELDDFPGRRRNSSLEAEGGANRRDSLVQQQLHRVDDNHLEMIITTSTSLGAAARFNKQMWRKKRGKEAGNEVDGDTH